VVEVKMGTTGRTRAGKRHAIELLINDKKLQRTDGSFNQSAAARLMGIGQPTLNRWALSGTGMRIDFKLKLVAMYNAPPEEYLDDTEIEFVREIKAYAEKWQL